MRLSSSLVLGSSALALAFTLVANPTIAHADEATSATAAEPASATAAAPATPPPTNEGGQPAAEEDDHKRFLLALNPLAASIGRYSIQGEYMPAKHHALVLNPFFTHAPITMTVNGQEVDGGSLTGFGGELGYKFYTGSKGPNGFYVGPSIIFANYSQSAAAGSAPAGSQGSDSFMSYGGAIDIGGQAVIGPGIVVGGGFGLQYTKNSEDISTDNLNLASAIIAGGGIRPRFLVSLGYAF